jgi:hypothetical protein
MRAGTKSQNPRKSVTRVNKKNYMSDEAFAELRGAFEDALALNAAKRRT